MLFSFFFGEISFLGYKVVKLTFFSGLCFKFILYKQYFMFYSNLYYLSGYFVPKNQNLIVKIFQIYSFGNQISFKNDLI